MINNVTIVPNGWTKDTWSDHGYTVQNNDGTTRYVDLYNLGVDDAKILAAANVLNDKANGQSEPLISTTSMTVISIIVPISVAVSAYHGYKRNESVGWALWWGFLGGIAPIITPTIAVAQGLRTKNPNK